MRMTVDNIICVFLPPSVLVLQGSVWVVDLGSSLQNMALDVIMYGVTYCSYIYVPNVTVL